MVDIHCHILPGVDDGARDMATSVEMCRIAAEDGIDAVVCAMHANDQYAFDPQLVRRKIEEVHEKTGGQPRLYPGCDFHLSYENVQSALADPRRHTINHGAYLLVEFAELAIPPNIGQVFFQFRSRGIVPIVTHPERNTWLVNSHEQLLGWVRAGALVQITSSSLLGKFGRSAGDFCRRLLERRLVHFVASDAHNSTSRPPRLKEAYQLVEAGFGRSYAERVFVEYPACALESRLFQAEEPREPARPGFWQRMARAFR